MKRYAYTLTINNPTMEDYITCSRYEEAMLKDDSHPDKIFRHIIFGMEGIEAKRTPHIQMAFYLKKPLTFKEVKTLFPRAHIEPVYAFYGLAVEYCKKEGFFVEYGKIEDALEHATEKHEAQKRLYTERQSKLKGKRLFNFSLLSKGDKGV